MPRALWIVTLSAVLILGLAFVLVPSTAPAQGLPLEPWGTLGRFVFDPLDRPTVVRQLRLDEVGHPVDTVGRVRAGKRTRRRQQGRTAVCYHIIKRGHNREVVFACADDFLYFLRLLHRYGLRL